jgi:hypothetical protein
MLLLRLGETPGVSGELQLDGDLGVGRALSDVQHHLPHGFHVAAFEVKPHGRLRVTPNLLQVLSHLLRKSFIRKLCDGAGVHNGSRPRRPTRKNVLASAQNLVRQLK